jgi:peptide/nickel transport system substrate-binding protein
MDGAGRQGRTRRKRNKTANQAARRIGTSPAVSPHPINRLPAGQADTQGGDYMAKLGRYLLAPVLAALMGGAATAQTMTDVGTPRNETLVVQTFDGKAANPDVSNPLNMYAIWRGYRELGWSFLWEMDTATGVSYPELAAGPVEVLNPEHTKFRIAIRPGVYWSDGVEFTTDDLVFTLDTVFKYRGKLNFTGAVPTYIKEGSWKKVDNYTMEVETVNPAYDFQTVMGVYSWGSLFIPVPKHIFEPLGDEVVSFKNTMPVTLGPYKIKEFDPNGFWQLWELRDDWERSGWGNLGKPKAKYVLYKDFGAEETRTLAFVQNQYDVDTFMSPDSIAAAKARNPNIQSFAPTLPYHDMSDACSYGIYINQQKAPFDLPEVRWALALTVDLQTVGITSVSGQFKAAALPIADTEITGPVFYDPLESFLNDLTLSDGYKPFNAGFGTEIIEKLKAQGVAADQLPTGDAIADGFGVGWWKYDPAEAEKLLASVGMKKGADGFYTKPDGSAWAFEFTIPADWNKVMQRVGFSIADSWRKAGFNVTARQVDNGEFTTVTQTNARLDLMVAWGNTCVYNANWLNSWRQINPDNIKPFDSTEALLGNSVRVTDPDILELVRASGSMEVGSEPFVENGREIARKLVETMQVINLMNIPTTIPTNNTYWTNFPKADNFYAAPYTWWSSFKKTLVNIEPTGAS